MKTLLLLDGDPLAYRFAHSFEGASVLGEAVRFDENPDAAIEAMNEEIERIRNELSADRILIALSCGPSWRKRIFPEYKANRDPDKKPALLGAMIDYLRESYECIGWPELEADDVIGILATAEAPAGAPAGEKIIFASIDKDFFCIPGTFAHLRVKPREGAGEGEHPPIEVHEVTLAAADQFHREQTLIGDSTDNYKGCPGIGAKKAPAIAAQGWSAIEHAFRVKGCQGEWFTQGALARILRADEFSPLASTVRVGAWATTNPAYNKSTADIVLPEPKINDVLAHRFLREITQRTNPPKRQAVAMSNEPKNTSSSPAGEPAAGAGPFTLTKPGGASQVKLLVWGESGVGKTPLALRFPKPCVIDMENGAKPYESSMEFGRMSASTPEQVEEALLFLQEGNHDFETLVIDPITVLWESLQAKWSGIFLRRSADRKGYKHEFFELGPSQWATIKSDWKSVIRRLSMVGMNVVAIARSKPLYAPGGTMVKVGDIFDCEKGTHYLFDTVIHLHGLDFETGTLKGHCSRDRFRRLPKGDIEISVEDFIQTLGTNERIEPVPLATDEQVQEFESLIEKLGVEPSVVSKRLSAYGVTSAADLKRSDAEVVLQKMNEKLNATAQ